VSPSRSGGAASRLVRIGTVEAEQVLVGSLLQADPTLRHRVIASSTSFGRCTLKCVSTRRRRLLLAAEIVGPRSYQVLGPLQERLRPGDAKAEAMGNPEQELSASSA
jgi:hypothetical protein